MKKLMIITLFLFASNILLFSQFGGGGPGDKKDNAWEIWNSNNWIEVDDSCGSVWVPAFVEYKHFKIMTDIMYSGLPKSYPGHLYRFNLHGQGKTILLSSGGFFLC